MSELKAAKNTEEALAILLRSPAAVQRAKDVFLADSWESDKETTVNILANGRVLVKVIEELEAKTSHLQSVIDEIVVLGRKENPDKIIEIRSLAVRNQAPKVEESGDFEFEEEEDDEYGEFWGGPAPS